MKLFQTSYRYAERTGVRTGGCYTINTCFRVVPLSMGVTGWEEGTGCKGMMKDGREDAEKR